MRVFDIPLSDKTGEHEPYMTAYLQEPMPQDPEKKLPAVVVYPGGGYTHLAAHEGESVAMAYSGYGFQTFVLYYSLAPYAHYPAQLLDGARALSVIREHAEEWNVDPEKIAILGFSAGGHAAATLGCLWDSPEVREAGIDPCKARPDACILGYSVITTKEGLCHEGSVVSLLGDRIGELREAMALESRVTENTPPMFLWHTAADGGVPVENSLMMAEALSAKKIPFELHVFPSGNHGLSLANRRVMQGHPERNIPEVAKWLPLSVDWLVRTFGLE